MNTRFPRQDVLSFLGAWGVNVPNQLYCTASCRQYPSNFTVEDPLYPRWSDNHSRTRSHCSNYSLMLHASMGLLRGNDAPPALRQSYRHRALAAATRRMSTLLHVYQSVHRCGRRARSLRLTVVPQTPSLLDSRASRLDLCCRERHPAKGTREYTWR
jgi:hypothetical protein